MPTSTSDAALAAAFAPRRSTRSSSSSTSSSATLASSTTFLPLKATKRTLSTLNTIKVEQEAEAPGEVGRQKKAADVQPERFKKKRRKGDYADLGDDPLTDRIKEGLLALACGENPGIRTAELQLHYASPANHFYKCLHAANLAGSSVLSPSDSRTIHEDWNVGITNLVARPTKEASELTAQELDAAVPVFLRKVAAYKPKVVFFVGMKVADVVLRYFTALGAALSASPPPSFTATVAVTPGKGKTPRTKKSPTVKAAIGWQPFALSHRSRTDVEAKKEEEGVEGIEEVLDEETTFFYCLPSTSGRVAAYPLPVKLKIWSTFGEEVAKLRAGGGGAKELNLPEGMRYFTVEELRLPDPVVRLKEEEEVVVDEVEVKIEVVGTEGE